MRWIVYRTGQHPADRMLRLTPRYYTDPAVPSLSVDSEETRDSRRQALIAASKASESSLGAGGHGESFSPKMRRT